MLKLFRRNGIIPVFTSILFDYEHNEVYNYTDSGRLTRPVYYIDNGMQSYSRRDFIDKLNENEITWQDIVSGLKKKSDGAFNIKNNKLYEISDLYEVGNDKEAVFNFLQKNKSIVDYVDTSEEESALIAINPDDLKKSKYYTHMEIDPSLILGVMGNLVIYPENNPVTRGAFSCGQSKQAVSVYHSNYQMRIDKMGVILNYGQIPLIKSRYMEYIDNEEQPYGVNAIVAIMSYTGYNVEDAILINEASVARGIFRTTYYSMYEAREESSKVTGSTNSKFANIQKNNVVKIKQGFDYSHLDDHGLIKENTELNDKVIVIGKINSNLENKDVWIDDSVKTKKGQLGFVDKSFITLGEEGFNIAKVRIREERIPAIGDKMASRAGQKGTLGLIIPEEDMPFTEDGIRPDLIINPHALPSRMTIGQIVESLFGKVCTSYGAFGDSTAFQVKGANYSTYAPLLVESGFHTSGNQILYNGMTGEQLEANIYIGPTYYMRLKHMVKDKINYRARGPNTMLTKQPVQGRANDGGLRIGEMERDGILAHGMSYFLNESFLIRGDEYYIAICNKTGAVAIYNEAKNLFLSPYADGPIQFATNPDGTQNIKNLSKFGRSFSILRVPYSLKLLIQELQVMNVQMRIITDDNVDQLLSMSYSDNINKLLQLGNKDLKDVTKDYTKDVSDKVNKDNKMGQKQFNLDEPPLLPDPAQIDTQPNSEEANSRYRTGQEVEVKNEELREFNYAQIVKVNFTDFSDETYDVRYADGEVEQQVPLSRIRPYNQGYVEQEVKSPENSTPLTPFSPGSQSYVPNSPPYANNSPDYAPNSPAYNPTSPHQQVQIQQQPIQQPIQIQITTPQATSPGILEVQPPPKEESKEESKDENASSSSSETKQINISNNSSDKSSSTDSTRKITL
jgi:hypothetical protein